MQAVGIITVAACYVLLQALSPFQLDNDQITDSGKFRHLDEILPLMKNRVVY